MQINFKVNRKTSDRMTENSVAFNRIGFGSRAAKLIAKAHAERTATNNLAASLIF